MTPETELDPPDTLNMALGAIHGVDSHCACILIKDDGVERLETHLFRQMILESVKRGTVDGSGWR